MYYATHTVLDPFGPDTQLYTFKTRAARVRDRRRNRRRRGVRVGIAQLFEDGGVRMNREWYAAHLDVLAGLMAEYTAEYLRVAYFELIEDGETPKEAFETVVCCALERDL